MLRAMRSLLLFPALLITLEVHAAAESPVRALQQAELSLFSAGTHLFIHRGEGRSAEQAAQVEADLRVLGDSLAQLQTLSLPAAQPQLAALQALGGRYSQKVRDTLAFEPQSADLPWEFNFEFSRLQGELWQALDGLRPLLQQEGQVTADQLELLTLPCKVESLASRYVARAYIGDIETLPDQQAYVSQDLGQLAQEINAQLTALQAKQPSEEAQSVLKEVRLRWKFIYGPLVDYSNGLAPLIVERHSSEMVKGLVALPL